jgi:hypothetical protein
MLPRSVSGCGGVFPLAPQMLIVSKLILRRIRRSCGVADRCRAHTQSIAEGVVRGIPGLLGRGLANHYRTG